MSDAHDAEEGGWGGRLAELTCDDLDAVLHVDGRDVEAECVAREAGHVFEPGNGWSERMHKLRRAAAYRW